MSAINSIHSDNHVPRCHRPSLAELGDDLLHVSRTRLLLTLSAPFILMAGYAFFSSVHMWPIAVLFVMALSFITYGSTSHDLVHRALKLPRRTNDLLLSIIELLSLRSGTAYRLSHLHHHANLLSHDDIEGESAHHNLWYAIISGPAMQLRLWLWAWRNHPPMRNRLLIELLSIIALITLSVVAIRWSPAPLVYTLLVITGSWTFPVITVFIPHNGHASESLAKTRLFRSRFAQLITFDHLYHLEHHLYPAVPHQHWKKLANRLDPYFASEGILPFDIKTSHSSAPPPPPFVETLP